MSYFRWDGEDLILECHLQPAARSDDFCGLHGERLKIRLTAPPVEGKANAYLMAFLAKAFGVAKSQVSLLARGTPRYSRLPLGALLFRLTPHLNESRVDANCLSRRFRWSGDAPSGALQ